MNIPFFIVDTFTTNRFKGNPTGICYLEDRLPTKHMLSITREINFPVTAFVTKSKDKQFAIRYFTSLTEITACGHATLGAASVVHKLTGNTHMLFHTAMETTLSINYENDAVCMSYPRFTMSEYAPNTALLESLQIQSYKSLHVCEPLETVFIELENPEQLQNIEPDFRQLLASDDSIKEVVVTCAGDGRPYHYLLRSFCPWIGINEDPVTGSVHSALAPYWAAKLGRTDLQAYQASKRGGAFGLCVEGDRVQIKGNCVFVLEGELQLA